MTQLVEAGAIEPLTQLLLVDDNKAIDVALDALEAVGGLSLPVVAR